jgi:hypothetical protein
MSVRSKDGICGCPFEQEGHKIGDGNCCFERVDVAADYAFNVTAWHYIFLGSGWSFRNSGVFEYAHYSYRCKSGYTSKNRNKKVIGYGIDFGSESMLIEINYIDLIAHGQVVKTYFDYAAAIHQAHKHGYLKRNDVKLLSRLPRKTKPAIYNGRKSRFCVWCAPNSLNDGGFFDLETHSLATLRKRSRKNFITFEWIDIVDWFGSLYSFNEYYGSSDENRQLAVEMCKGFYNEKYGRNG